MLIIVENKFDYNTNSYFLSHENSFYNDFIAKFQGRIKGTQYNNSKHNDDNFSVWSVRLLNVKGLDTRD